MIDDPNLPKFWIDCPEMGELVQNLFYPFKTIVDERFNSIISPKKRFNITKMNKIVITNSIGLIVDLTPSNIYYDSKKLKKTAYERIFRDEDDIMPTKSHVMKFQQIVKEYTFRDHTGKIGVHCDYGFNLTGFMIVSYILITQYGSLNNALNLFAESRFPGIFESEYIDLLKTVFEIDDDVIVPDTPSWAQEKIIEIHPKRVRCKNKKEQPLDIPFQELNVGETESTYITEQTIEMPKKRKIKSKKEESLNIPLLSENQEFNFEVPEAFPAEDLTEMPKKRGRKKKIIEEPLSIPLFSENQEKKLEDTEISSIEQKTGMPKKRGRKKKIIEGSLNIPLLSENQEINFEDNSLEKVTKIPKKRGRKKILKEESETCSLDKNEEVTIQNKRKIHKKYIPNIDLSNLDKVEENKEESDFMTDQLLRESITPKGTENIFSSNEDDSYDSSKYQNLKILTSDSFEDEQNATEKVTEIPKKRFRKKKMKEDDLEMSGDERKTIEKIKKIPKKRGRKKKIIEDEGSVDNITDAILRESFTPKVIDDIFSSDDDESSLNMKIDTSETAEKITELPIKRGRKKKIKEEDTEISDDEKSKESVDKEEVIRKSFTPKVIDSIFSSSDDDTETPKCERKICIRFYDDIVNTLSMVKAQAEKETNPNVVETIFVPEIVDMLSLLPSENVKKNEIPLQQTKNPHLSQVTGEKEKSDNKICQSAENEEFIYNISAPTIVYQNLIRKAMESSHKFHINSEFVQPVLDFSTIEFLRNKVRNILKTTIYGFIGVKYVNLSWKNFDSFKKEDYLTTWISNGKRYLLFVVDANEIYFIDENNWFYKISNLQILNKVKIIRNSIFDGELVSKSIDGNLKHAYMISNIYVYRGRPFKANDFSRRLHIIGLILKKARDHLDEGDLAKEPFKIEIKKYSEAVDVYNLWSNANEEVDYKVVGLSFYPHLSQYHNCLSNKIIYLWQPRELKTVHFKFKSMFEKNGETLVGQLFLSGSRNPYATIGNVSQSFIKEMNNKILKCRLSVLFTNKWTVNEEEIYKKTAISKWEIEDVVEDLKRPITIEDLKS